MSRVRPKPQPGDLVLHCAHVLAGAAKHWWKWNSGEGFTRPDGTTGIAQWLIACDHCFTRSGGTPAKIAIVGDVIFEKGMVVEYDDED